MQFRCNPREFNKIFKLPLSPMWEGKIPERTLGMRKISGAESIRFIRHLETVLKQLLNVADVQIIVETDPDSVWGDDESLLETTETRGTDRAS